MDELKQALEEAIGVLLKTPMPPERAGDVKLKCDAWEKLLGPSEKELNVADVWAQAWVANEPKITGHGSVQCTRECLLNLCRCYLHLRKKK